LIIVSDDSLLRPQSVYVPVGGAECGLNLRCGTIVRNRQDACSTKSEFSCGTGILPVHKKLIDNSAISQI
ncbi:hypothetical protein QUB12_27250, partial [Microcoleus sp. B7-D4]